MGTLDVDVIRARFEKREYVFGTFRRWIIRRGYSLRGAAGVKNLVLVGVSGGRTMGKLVRDSLTV